MSQICAYYGISRQAHYQQQSRNDKRSQKERQIVKMVQEIRQHHPQMGGRKVLHKCQPLLAQKGLSIGRDDFFDLLARHDLLIPPKRQKRRTTFSGRWRCPNRLLDLEISQPGQAWVCDLTYLETENGFCYLALVTDIFSRFIVGCNVSTSLAVEGARAALNQAIAQAPYPLQGLIHHSDHGIQYTCHAYRDRLAQTQILSSLGEVGNCYDNALAERVNGILKLEYGLGDRLLDFDHAHALTCQAVWLYNHDRPHLSLDYKLPVEVHFNALHKSISS